MISRRLLKVVITTMDNLRILEQQAEILRGDPLVNAIVVVNNGSLDGTREWLALQRDLIVVNRENRGAGPGRNSGLDAAGEFDYVLMLDGGVRPLRGGVEKMLAFLEKRANIDVLGVDHRQTVTTEEEAWCEWTAEIQDEDTYRNCRLSQTHYCLARHRAFAGLRFSEEGPFGEPGWGVDDDEMAYRWFEAGIIVHAVTTVHPFRRASGSFQRLFRETGIWPNQYGSVYEQRLVFCQQNWPQFAPGIQWGEPWLTIVIRLPGGLESSIRLIKRSHDRMRQRSFPGRWSAFPNPYSVVAFGPLGHPFLDWAEWRRLRQHHGDVILVKGAKVVRSAENEALWTGDFRVWTGSDYLEALRPNSHYFCLVRNPGELEQCAARFDEIHPSREAAPVVVRTPLPAGPSIIRD